MVTTRKAKYENKPELIFVDSDTSEVSSGIIDDVLVQKIKNNCKKRLDDFIVNDSDEEDGDYQPGQSTEEGSEECSEEECSDTDSEYAEGETIDDMLDELKETDMEAYKNLMQVKDEIEKRMPKIVEVLKAPLRIKDKAQLVELYEIFTCTQPLTEDWLELRHRFNSLYKKYKKDYKLYSTYKEKEIQQLKEVSKDLKTSNSIQSDFTLKQSILSLNTSRVNKQAIYNRYTELRQMEDKDDEYAKLKKWIHCAIELPHDNLKSFDMKGEVFTKFMRDVNKKLDSELYGMQAVKEQLLIFINSKLTNPNMKGCSLGLVGPPGVGKTTIARYLSEALQWPFEQISFGGMTNQDYLKGHDYTYVGARPGEIARCMSRMKYKNGILFLDEFEKISDNRDIVSFLLHMTDPQQNSTFRDNYLSDITLDLSQMWFIYSMNQPPEDPALRDRIFTIKVPGYSTSDKIKILINHILPKTLKNIGYTKDKVIINEDAAKHIIHKLDSKEEGIRGLESCMKDMINKLHFMVTHQNEDGSLDGFDHIKVKVNKKLQLPIQLTNDLIDIFIKSGEARNTSIDFMYM